MRAWRNFLTALGFLTRLAPAKACQAQDLADSLGWFAAVGLTLGLCAAAPVYLGLFKHSPLAGAWCILLLNLYLTRFLHFDGLADLGDAWGSCASGEKFWEIVKDSRLGAFGALAMILASCGFLVFYAELLGQGRLGSIVWSMVLGRGMCVGLLGLSQGLARPGLAAQFRASSGNFALWLNFAFVIISGLFLVSLSGFVMSVLLGLGVLAGLYRLAKREEGLNGDFLGASIVLCELAACLACAI